MSCVHSDFNSDKCGLYDGTIEMPGVDEETGVCICDDDPDPTFLCENYEER